MSDEELRKFVAETRTLIASNTALYQAQARAAAPASAKDTTVERVMGGYLDD